MDLNIFADEEGSDEDMDRDEDVGHYMDEEEERDMTSHMDEDNENCGCERSTKPKKALPPEDWLHLLVVVFNSLMLSILCCHQL
jgi:hypothetical protein